MIHAYSRNARNTRVVFLLHLSRQSTSRLFYSNLIKLSSQIKKPAYSKTNYEVRFHVEEDLESEFFRDKITPENNICTRKLNEIKESARFSPRYSP